MGGVNRVASLVVVVAFLCNIFLSDIGFAKEVNFSKSSSTLATAARTDDIMGLERQDTTSISIWFKGCMSLIQKKGLAVNLDNIRNPNIVPDKIVNALKGFKLFRREASFDAATGIITIKARKSNRRTYIIEYETSNGTLRVYPQGKAPTRNISPKPASPDMAKEKDRVCGIRLVSMQEMITMSRILERDVIDMIFKAGSGHPGGSLSMLKMLAVLYFRTSSGKALMTYDPNDPDWENRDRFVLSKGHAAPGLYAVLGRAGFFPTGEFDKLRKLGSKLQGHSDMTKTPGVDMSAGSLGVGISAAVGMALAAKMDNRTYKTYIMLGDGETQEGQVDEAARWASSMKLDNIIAFLDWNGMQIDGKVTETDVDYDGQVKLWRARGWHVIEANGERVEDIWCATESANRGHDSKPIIIIARTSKGARLPGMDKHGAAPKEADVKQAFGIIDADIEHMEGAGFNLEAFMSSLRSKVGITAEDKEKIDRDNRSSMAEQDVRRASSIGFISQKYNDIIAGVEEGYPANKKVSTRTANGDELALLGKDNRVVAICADLKGSVMFNKFAEAFGTYSPVNTVGRYVPAGIREAHMVSMAVGLAACGKIPVIGTFSIFTTRMVDQINAILNTKLPLIIVGTHGGLATGPDGRTHQDAHSLGVLGQLPGVQTYEGADAQEERVLLKHIYETAKERGGVHYIRPARLDTPIIAKPEGWEEGAKRGFYALYDSKPVGATKDIGYDVVIVSSGVTAVDAVEAAKELSNQGKSVKVINVTQLKSVDSKESRRAFAGMIGNTDRIITVIDSLPEILADRLNSVLVQERIHVDSVKTLGIDKYGESGTPAELYALHGFDKTGILKAAQVSALLKFREIGQQIWLDGLTWEMVANGEFEELVKTHGITGVTTNPTLIKAYLNDKQVLAKVAALAAKGLTRDQVYFEVIKELAQAVITVFNRCGVNGKFSVELSPDKADDVVASVAEARMWTDIDPKHIMVKVAATEAGFKIIEEVIAAGRNVNATLIFTKEQYEAVALAYVSGLERAAWAGHNLSKIYSVASFFVSRWDVGLAKDAPESIQGKIANAVTIGAYNKSFKGIFSSERFVALQAKGANVQDFLVASTGSKAKDMIAKGVIPEEYGKYYPPLVYVEPIAGKNVVNTLPLGTIKTMIDKGVTVANTMDENYSWAPGVLAEAGKIADLDEVGAKLLDAGMKSFLADFATIMKTIDDAIKTATTKPESPDMAKNRPQADQQAVQAEEFETTAVSATREDKRIREAVKLATRAGLNIPVVQETQFTLLVTSEFYANGELKDHQEAYGDRFKLDSVSGRTADEFIANILTNPYVAQDRTIVLLPNELAGSKFEDKHYQALKDAGIRFMITDRNELLKARADKDEYRSKFQLDTYAVMLLVRAINEKTDKSSSIYRVLSFYLKTHFNFAEKMAIDDYIMAIAKSDIGKLVIGVLAYRPAVAYDKPDYEKVAATLISA